MSQPFQVAIFLALLIVNGTALTFALSLAEHLASGDLIAHKVGNGTSEFCVFSLQAVTLTAQAVVRVLKSEVFNLEFVNQLFEIYFH